MKSRIVHRVLGNTQIEEFELADIDVEGFLDHSKKMKPTAMLLVDDDVVFPGLFQSDAIASIRKKVRAANTRKRNKQNV